KEESSAGLLQKTLDSVKKLTPTIKESTTSTTSSVLEKTRKFINPAKLIESTKKVLEYINPVEPAKKVGEYLNPVEPIKKAGEYIKGLWWKLF
ncbi:hypothetical protein KKC49_03305, partial [Patescibacteria group bacterium]|nr:hypothetical protein [Patescibacteria group bacterium]